MHIDTNKYQDDESPGPYIRQDKGKAPAPAATAHKRSPPPTTTGNERRKVRRISAGEGMTTIATSIDTQVGSLADTVSNAVDRVAGSGPDIDIEDRAMDVIEEEEGLETEDLAYAAMFIAGDNRGAKAYLRFKDKAARTLFLFKMINKVKKEE
jgi:hypothetical protein